MVELIKKCRRMVNQGLKYALRPIVVYLITHLIRFKVVNLVARRILRNFPKVKAKLRRIVLNRGLLGNEVIGQKGGGQLMGSHSTDILQLRLSSPKSQMKHVSLDRYFSVATIDSVKKKLGK